LLGQARREQPRADLEARVLDSLAYRMRLSSDVGAEQGIEKRVVYGALAFAAAAAALLWITRASEPDRATFVDHEPVEVGREPLAPSTAPAANAANEARVPPEGKVEDPCMAAFVANGTAPLIDDFEDGDDAVMANEGRSGLWRWVRDTDDPGTAPALLPVPREPRTAKSKLALRVKGDRLREWGATVEFVFTSKCYDASAYAGIAFEAMGSTRIYLAPREVNVMPAEAGGTCVEDCHNNHVAQLELESRWQTFEVRFTEVEQRGYDRPALDPKRLHSIAFLIRPEDTPYDVWLDDVRFIEQ
jgi:hypothetical protein